MAKACQMVRKSTQKQKVRHCKSAITARHIVGMTGRARLLGKSLTKGEWGNYELNVPQQVLLWEHTNVKAEGENFLKKKKKRKPLSQNTRIQQPVLVLQFNDAIFHFC